MQVIHVDVLQSCSFRGVESGFPKANGMEL